MNELTLGLQCCAQAYDDVRWMLRPGVKETDVLKTVESAFQKTVGYLPEYQYDLVSGQRAGNIGGIATERVIQAGDCVIIDLLPCIKGVWCDVTRTFFVGEVSSYWALAYQTALDAMTTGEKLLAPGISGAQIYETVNREILGKGYATLPHHAGHAVGAEPLENPDFLPDEKELLSEHQIVTLEPGIYCPNENGIRVENNYSITQNGCTPLFLYPTQLENFIIQE